MTRTQIANKALTGPNVVWNKTQSTQKDEITIFEITSKYLIDKQLTYGVAVDTRDVLAYSGIEVDQNQKEVFQKSSESTGGTAEII